MPLSPPVEREHIHNRRVECTGYRREDGLWDIEGRLTDTKAYDFSNHDRGLIAAGDPVHDMWIRLTVDDTLTVRAVEAVTDKAPFTMCADITPAFEKLVGAKISSGWRRAVRERLGGVRGCTHLVELLSPLATAAFQTVFPVLSRERTGKIEGDANTSERPPALLNSCHAFAADSPVVARIWPKWHVPADQPDDVST